MPKQSTQGTPTRRPRKAKRQNPSQGGPGTPAPSEGIDLEEVRFDLLLAPAERLLIEAERLAGCAEDGPLDEMGERLLFRVVAGWLDLEAALIRASLIGDSSVFIPCPWYERDDPRLAAFQSVRELAVAVRDRSDWRKHLPDRPGVDITSLSLNPLSTMGVSHAVFAKRLGLAIEHLWNATAICQPPKGGLTLKAANDRAMQLAEADSTFVARSSREWAKAIGCSAAQVIKLPLWKETMKRTGRGGTRPGSGKPKALSLTDSLEATLPDGNGRGRDQLQRLIAEQQSDNEPSPLSDDPPSPHRRKVRGWKRV